LTYLLILVLVTWLLLIAAGIVYQWIGLFSDAVRYPPPGRLIQVGPNRLHVYELGEGSPTVVFEAGISATSVNWRRVQTRLAEFTRVVSYDRAGLGWSDPARTPRTASQITDELYEMLQAAGIPPPYVMVAHSFGYLVLRLYAMRHPGEVMGFVLVDPIRPQEWHPLSAEQRRNLRGGAFLSSWGALLAHFGVVRFTLARLARGSSALPRFIGRTTSTGAGLATMERLVGEVRKMPQELWPAIISHWCHPKSLASMGRHLAELPAGIASVIDAEPLRDVPVIVLTGATSGTKWRPGEITGISTETTHIVAGNSGHWIQLDEPELVVDAVRELVTRVREREQSLR
jgi:pimeloyl-ACP methyl ester carboxylesterase